MRLPVKNVTTQKQFSEGIHLFDSLPNHVSLSNNIVLMKKSHLIWIMILIITLHSCSRAITPYEAANNPRGRHCKRIR
jgi:hypothetical protein